MNLKGKQLIFAAALLLCSLVLLTNAIAGDVTVNIASTKQVIRGYGACSAWCGALSDGIMNSLYNTLGYTILRLRIAENEGWNSGNYNAWADELSNAKKANARGAIVFASPWNPPASMQENFSKSGDSNAQRLRYDRYDMYVQYLNSFVTYLKNNGVNLYAISVQNEPDYANDWNWWTPQEMLNFMKNNAGSINCRVMAPESFQFLKNMSDPILNDTQALANMDILGCHFYGTSTNNMAYPLYQQKGAGKELWMTEKYFDDDNPGTVMSMAREIHDSMVTGNMNAYVYWWITWGNGLCTSSGTLYKRAYILGQYAKYIRPDYYRVDATASPANSVYVSAYTGNNQVVIVAINQNTSSVSQRFVLQNGTASQVSSWVTNTGSNMATGSALTVSGGAFTANLSAQSVTTFVASLSGTSGTPTPAGTPTATPLPTPTPGPLSAFNQIEAENFTTQSGVQTETCNEGGEDVGYIENGDYLAFANVDFGNGAMSFKARVASAASGGNIELRLGSSTGTLIGTCAVAGTGDWQTWNTVSCNVSGASGSQNLYLVFTGGNGYLFNLNWFQFVASSAPTPTPDGMKGDVNGSGTVDIVDALMIAQYSVGLNPTGFIAANADVNCDGSINIVDALMVAQYFVGLITGFTC